MTEGRNEALKAAQDKIQQAWIILRQELGRHDCPKHLRPRLTTIKDDLGKLHDALLALRKL